MSLSPWPRFESDEIAAVTAVLESGRTNYLVGDEGRQFEQEFARRHGAAYGVAVANGTLALELALIALGIGEGDDVVVTARSFIATASAIAHVGARPVFADIDRDSQNLAPASAEAAVTPATRAILAVHLAGWPADMDGLRDVATRHGLALVEDGAQAHGAARDGRPVGSFGDAAAFSFCQDKIMPTGGEGGMVLCHDRATWQRAWEYKDHGKSWEAVYEREHPPGFRWLHESLGTNWRLTEMQSAIGRCQLAKLDDWVARRQAHAQRLAAAAEPHACLRVPWPRAGISHSFYKFYGFVVPERLAPGWTRQAIQEALQEDGIPARQGVCPEMYREGVFAGSAMAPPARLPVARELGETAIMLPVHPSLADDEVAGMAAALDRVLARAGGAA